MPPTVAPTMTSNLQNPAFMMPLPEPIDPADDDDPPLFCDMHN